MLNSVFFFSKWSSSTRSKEWRKNLWRSFRITSFWPNPILLLDRNLSSQEFSFVGRWWLCTLWNKYTGCPRQAKSQPRSLGSSLKSLCSSSFPKDLHFPQIKLIFMFRTEEAVQLQVLWWGKQSNGISQQRYWTLPWRHFRLPCFVFP